MGAFNPEMVAEAKGPEGMAKGRGMSEKSGWDRVLGVPDVKRRSLGRSQAGSSCLERAH